MASLLCVMTSDPYPFPCNRCNRATFKQVVGISDDEVISKIHQNYRIQYIKDVILLRYLDGIVEQQPCHAIRMRCAPAARLR
jgi:hypothetical protein